MNGVTMHRYAFHFYAITDCIAKKKKSDTKYKWNDSLREQFRSGIIRILPTFNDIVHNINCPDRDSINVLVDKFSNTIRDVADPLFAKNCFYTHDVYFEGFEQNRTILYYSQVYIDTTWGTYNIHSTKYIVCFRFKYGTFWYRGKSYLYKQFESLNSFNSYIDCLLVLN